MANARLALAGAIAVLAWQAFVSHRVSAFWPLAVLVFGVAVGRFAAEPTPWPTDVAVPTIHVETGRAYRSTRTASSHAG